MHTSLDGSPAQIPADVAGLLPADALTNQHVIDMLITDGLPAKIVAEKIKKAKKNCVFDTSREALKQLRSAGVDDSVIYGNGAGHLRCSQRSVLHLSRN